jgi:ABC-type phosphonate transport system ATPase subunit
MNAAEVVTVQHLVKRYGNVLAVNDVSFSIREGEIFGRTETRSERWSVSSCRRAPCLHGSGWERQ